MSDLRTDAANVLFHVVNVRHLKKRPMIFTTNKLLHQWGRVLHDEDLAAAILDRILERGRLLHLDGPSHRTRHLQLDEGLADGAESARISGIGLPECPEPATNVEPLRLWTDFGLTSTRAKRLMSISAREGSKCGRAPRRRGFTLAAGKNIFQKFSSADINSNPICIFPSRAVFVATT